MRVEEVGINDGVLPFVRRVSEDPNRHSDIISTVDGSLGLKLAAVGGFTILATVGAIKFVDWAAKVVESVRGL